MITSLSRWTYGQIDCPPSTTTGHHASSESAARQPILPSEYFRRQIFATFWFEQDSLPLIGDCADNVMFETDFPHSTALSPGPASSAPSPRQIVEEDARVLDRAVMEKVSSTNARELYRIR
jgi:uncharacterized protein